MNRLDHFRVAVWALVASPLLSPIVATPVQTRQSNATEIKDFALIKPSPELQWTPCFSKFTCAVLEVPLDYVNTSAGTVGIAFIKWTAQNSSSAHDILVNPGGPGISGVDTVLQRIDELQIYLGSSNNIVGFDPRGVNNSGPELSCFPGKRDTAKLYNPQWSQPVDSTSKSAMLERWAGAGAFGEWCSAHAADSPARYVNTVATANDMLRFAELAAEAKGQKKEDAKVWYFGGSYGTILGTTFAALFPSKVGRFILDGVGDAEDYYSGKRQSSIVDADKVVLSFFKDCFTAGKQLCDFWDPSPEAIERRFNAIVQDITTSPIIVTDRTQVQTPIIITLSDLKNYLAKVVYTPVQWFPELATVLAGLENRNGTYFARVTGLGGSVDQSSPNEGPQSQQYEPNVIITCNDAAGRFNLSTIDAFTDNVNILLDRSKWLGEWWANFAVRCRSLEVSKYVPDSQIFRGVPSAVNTSTPILFVSTKVDPATPLTAAKKMAARFPGSRLLVQNNVGHTGTSAFSVCARNVRLGYLADGTLPEEDTACEVEQVPFKPFQIGGMKA